MKTCPNCNQAFFDDTYNFCLQDGSLLSNSDELEVETVISNRKIKVNVSSSLNNSIAVLNAPIIAINIAQQYPFVKNASELYEVTRGLWRLSRKRAEKAKYAFAVFRGEIKEVYVISYWEPARFDSNDFWVKRKGEQGVVIDASVNEGRYQFVGKIADDFIRTQYVGKKMPVPHGQNPIRYFNC